MTVHHIKDYYKTASTSERLQAIADEQDDLQDDDDFATWFFTGLIVCAVVIAVVLFAFWRLQ